VRSEARGARPMPRDVGWEWKATGWWVQPRDAREVMTMIGSIGVYSTGQQFAWRGMSSADYALTSSLHRHVGGFEAEVRRSELEMMQEARDWGLGTYPTGQVDDLQLLSDLQHYGIATRLIDVTSNPMTALWFACQAASNVNVAKSGLLIAINVTGWPRLSTVAPAGVMTYDQMEDPRGARLTAALRSERPFVLESASPNDRLRAQEGFFISGSIPDSGSAVLSSDPFLARWESPVDPIKSIRISRRVGESGVLREQLMEPRGTGAPRSIPFVAMIIPASVKSRLLKYLQGSYNRSARVLFPDYEGYRQFGAHAARRVQSASAANPLMGGEV
jgi:hypothetical protein